MCSVCPWWLGFALVNPLRLLVQRPEEIMRPWLRDGMTVLDAGCGNGFFTLPAARLVGPGGRVIAVDLQARMLEGLARRAERDGLTGRIEPRLCARDDLRVTEKVDFALAFWVVHEAPDPSRFLDQLAGALAPGGRLLLVEPTIEVSELAFRLFCGYVSTGGLRLTERPRIRLSRVALFEAPAGSGDVQATIR
jgi:SAM-dependent methyltransferase